VEAMAGGDYDLAFDSVTMGPMQGGAVASSPSRKSKKRRAEAQHKVSKPKQ